MTLAAVEEDIDLESLFKEHLDCQWVNSKCDRTPTWLYLLRPCGCRYRVCELHKEILVAWLGRDDHEQLDCNYHGRLGPIYKSVRFVRL